MIDKIHHVGIAVRDLDKSLEFYRDVLGLHVHAIDTVEDQGVRAALLTIGESEIELLEPTHAEANMAKFIERK
ncbi:MAG: VOC family protein, partial [Chloroflexota bacterium]